MKRYISLLISLLFLISTANAYAEDIQTDISQPLIDTGELYLEYTGTVIHNGNLDEYLIEFYAENRSASDITLKTLYTDVNGVGINGYMDDRISGMCRGYIYLHILDTCMDLLTSGNDFFVGFRLQVLSGTNRYAEVTLEDTISINTGLKDNQESPQFDLNELKGTLLRQDGKTADIRIEGVRWLEPYSMYEIYGFAKNKTEGNIYAYTHDLNIAGTDLYDQGDFLIGGGKTGEIAAYITEEMLYMNPDPDDIISFSFDVIDDSVSYDSKTEEYPPIDRAVISLKYESLINVRNSMEG